MSLTKSFAQYDEDLSIIDFFKESKGVFLDLGANDGITLSNTYNLFLQGWSGVLVEASPIVFENLRRNFISNDNVQCLNLCISDFEGITTFYHNINHINSEITPENTDLLSTIDKTSYKRTKNWGSFRTFEIQCHKFETVLSMSKFNKFDFISIDLEGVDLKVLRQIDLSKLEVKALIIEYNNDLNMRKSIVEYCDSHGLKRILLDNKQNMIICR